MRETTYPRPLRRALCALMALVLAVGLMPLPGFQQQSAFAAPAFEKSQNISLTDSSENAVAQAVVTLSVDKTTVAPGGYITATWTFDLGNADAKWHWGATDTIGSVWLSRTGDSENNKVRPDSIFSSVTVKGDGIAQCEDDETKMVAVRIKAAWTVDAQVSLRKAVVVERIDVKSDAAVGSVYYLQPSVNVVTCSDSGGNIIAATNDLNGWDFAVTIGEETLLRISEFTKDHKRGWHALEYHSAFWAPSSSPATELC